MLFPKVNTVFHITTV